MKKIIKKEKCISCSNGTVTFIKWEDELISGNCNYCGYCCNESQQKFKKE